MQQDDHPGENSCGDKPGRHGESEDLTDEDRDAERIRAVPAVFSLIEVFAYCEAYYEEREKFGDYHGGENLDAHCFPEAAFVYQDLSDDAQARKR